MEKAGKEGGKKKITIIKCFKKMDSYSKDIKTI